MFIPDLNGDYIDLMATSGESLQIYEIDDQKRDVQLKLNLKNVSTQYHIYICLFSNYIGYLIIPYHSKMNSKLL